MANWSGPQVGAALHALGALGMGPLPGRFAAEALPRLRSCLADLSPAELAAAAWGVATLRVRPPPAWLDALLDAAAAAGPAAFGDQPLADLLWALARLRYQPSAEWMAPVLGHIGGRAAAMAPQALGISLWALSVLEYEPPEGAADAFRASAGGGEYSAAALAAYDAACARRGRSRAAAVADGGGGVLA
jgi:hypothetical protein